MAMPITGAPNQVDKWVAELQVNKQQTTACFQSRYYTWIMHNTFLL